MANDDLWALEKRFWTDGADFYRAAMDPAATMVFRPPVGILVGEEIVDGVEHGAPRWADVAFSEQRVQAPSDEIRVLAYVAEGLRAETTSQKINCSSTYRREGADWRLIQHQQTPAS